MRKREVMNEVLKILFLEESPEDAVLNNAQHLAQFGIWESDLRTGRQKWSDGTFRIYGYEPGEVEPSEDLFLKMIHPEDLPVIRQMITDVRQLKMSFREYEFRIIDQKGASKYIYARLKVESDGNQSPVRVVGFNLDVTQRKLAEIAVKRSEQEYKSLFDQNPDVVFSLDLRSRFTKVNAAFVRLVGSAPEDLLGRDFREVLGKTRLESVYANFLAGLGGQSQRYETRFTNKNGRSFTLDITLMSILVDGEIVGVHCIAKDITEKKELEVLLGEAYRSARIGGWEVELPSEKVNWTEITRELHEVGPDFQPDLESAITFYEEGESRNAIRRAVCDGINKGSPWDLELQIVTANGNKRWVRAMGQAEFKNGKCKRLYGTFQDIDRRKKAEETLKDAYQEKVNILESIGDAFFAMDDDGVVTYWNHVAESLLSMPREKVVGNNIWEVYADAISSPFYEHLHKAIRGRVPIHYQEFYAPLNMWIEGNVYPSASGVSVYFKDVTEEKKRLQAIEEQNKKLKDIAWIQSHEVRAPLARILGLIHLLNEDANADDELRKVLNLIERSAGELDGLIRKIVRKTEAIERTQSYG